MEIETVKAGRWFLSGERLKDFENTYDFQIANGVKNPLPFDESFIHVYDSDVENLKLINTQGYI